MMPSAEGAELDGPTHASVALARDLWALATEDVVEGPVAPTETLSRWRSYSGGKQIAELQGREERMLVFNAPWTHGAE
jgi:hypothetical protein